MLVWMHPNLKYSSVKADEPQRSSVNASEPEKSSSKAPEPQTHD